MRPSGTPAVAAHVVAHSLFSSLSSLPKTREGEIRPPFAASFPASLAAGRKCMQSNACSSRHLSFRGASVLFLLLVVHVNLAVTTSSPEILLVRASALEELTFAMGGTLGIARPGGGATPGGSFRVSFEGTFVIGSSWSSNP